MISFSNFLKRLFLKHRILTYVLIVGILFSNYLKRLFLNTEPNIFFNSWDSTFKYLKRIFLKHRIPELLWFRQKHSSDDNHIQGHTTNYKFCILRRFCCFSNVKLFRTLLFSNLHRKMFVPVMQFHKHIRPNRNYVWFL